MLPPLKAIWDATHHIVADPAFDAALLLAIIAAEIHAIWHNRIQTGEAKKQTTLADKTYDLYRTYFEVTEKRKADAREKAAATRAAKKAASAEPEPVPEPETLPPKPPNGKAPPPMTLPEDEEELPESP